MKSNHTTVFRFSIMGLILLASGLIFATLAEDILRHETFFRLDPVLGTWLLTQTTPPGDQLFSLVTLLGNAVFISGSTALLGIWFAWKQRWNRLAFLFASVGGAAISNLILKYLIARPRPDFPQAFLHDTGYSFPSGHAMISIAFYGAITYLLLTAIQSWKYKSLAVFATLLIAFLIGFSRLYLGVHYLSDVLAGWAASGAWLIACILVDNILMLKKIDLREKLGLMKLT